ncbi:MAG: bifunctional precorrin-2 dehydrogenase/sirohydrochlorin ferrochelatase [Thermogemmatispora sp.]|uniref:precorrin-2 dehydrogenase/sirohydrochlorin ferrochelatase family protein n=1 Tax=Thermogemmatispora sp. TaxID=1968838 RepID=UPI0026329A0D|nr:bifunctional precorrin-2 dehydrogenase/sirohydrochlorin ferrochelatase [Thermogemmatispora sp.]MBX5458924.1 bifunctional precorrin-2 dehydrogenase/sirohydrochlorin ferrochelatase [Thermogemmatispora sp.]
MPNYYPIMLDVRGRRVVVIGGDRIAAEKVQAFAACGAQVCVIAPVWCAELERVAQELGGQVEARRRPYQPGDLEGAFVVIATTREPELVEAVWSEAQQRGQLLNIVDLPERCNFITPSILRRDPLTVAVSTEGASPGLAKLIRQELEQHFPRTYGAFLRLAAEARALLRAQGVTYERRDAFFQEFYRSPVLARLEAGAEAEARALTAELLRQYGVEVPCSFEEDSAGAVDERSLAS